MAKQEFPFDRSAAFTALLDLSPSFDKLEDRNGDIVTTFLKAWYRDEKFLDMYKFCREWLFNKELGTPCGLTNEQFLEQLLHQQTASQN